MRCPECQKLNLKSRVYERYSMCLPMGGGHRFWDEDGKEHYHNADMTYTVYRCSNGHEWAGDMQTPHCWCGYPEKQEDRPPPEE